MSKKATIKDIANLLNVSTTTVTKALRDLPRISDEMRQKVIKTAEEVGYKPNTAAQALAGSRIKLVAIYAIDAPEYFRYFEKGLNAALEELSSFRVDLDIRHVAGIYDVEGMKKHLREIRGEKIDGVILLPILRNREYYDEVMALQDDGVPILFCTQEFEDAQGIGTFQVNWSVIGKLAAQVFNWVLPQNSNVAIITTNKEFLAHQKCIQGFREELDHEKITDIQVFENQDNREITYLVTKNILDGYPGINGIYVTSYNAVQVCKCLEDNGMAGKIAVIGQDLYPELVSYMNKGHLLATVFPNQFLLSYNSVRHLFRYVSGLTGARNEVITPQLITKANLECYIDYVKEDDDD